MYQFREITLKNGSQEKKILTIEFDQPEMKIVGEFLMADARLVDDSVLEAIERVLTGVTECVESGGNRCGLIIKADTTVIYDLFEDDADVETYPPYEMETKKLRALIRLWIEKLDEWKRSNR